VSRISVVIPTIGRQYLVSAVESVLLQLESGDECVVVVDGPRSLPRLPASRQVRIVRLAISGGPGAARNAGAATVTGDHLLFLDDDDEVAPDGVTILRQHAAPGMGVVGWEASLHADASTTIRKRNYVADDEAGRIGARPVPNVGATLVPFEAFVPFDVRLPASEDVEWWMRQAPRMCIQNCRDVVLLSRRHDAPRRSGDVPAKLAAREEIIARHADYLAAHPAAAHYQFRRAAGFAYALNDMTRARRYYTEAFRRRPTLRGLARVLQTSARLKPAA